MTERRKHRRAPAARRRGWVRFAPAAIACAAACSVPVGAPDGGTERLDATQQHAGPNEAAQATASVAYRRIKVVDAEHLEVNSTGDYGPHCDVLAVPPAARAGRERAAGLRGVREFIRDVTYGAYQWRQADGAQVKFVRETASRPLPNGRPRTWMVIAGSAPGLFSGNINDLNQNLLTQSFVLGPESAYMKMAFAALEDALDAGVIPPDSDLLLTGHSQGGNIATVLAILLEPTAYGLTAANPAHNPLFVSLGLKLKAKGVRLGGGLTVAHRAARLVERRAAALAPHYGHFFSRVVVQGDPVPFLGTDALDTAIAQGGALGAIFGGVWGEDLGALTHGVQNLVPLFSPSQSTDQSWRAHTMHFADRTHRFSTPGAINRSGVNLHGQAYIDKFNSHVTFDVKRGRTVTPVCQPDVIRVPVSAVAAGSVLIDVMRNDYLPGGDRPGGGAFVEADGHFFAASLPAAKLDPTKCAPVPWGLVSARDPACFDPPGRAALVATPAADGRRLRLDFATSDGSPLGPVVAVGGEVPSFSLVTSYRVLNQLETGTYGSSNATCQGTVEVQVVADGTPPGLLSPSRLLENGQTLWVPTFNLAYRPVGGASKPGPQDQWASSYVPKDAALPPDPLVVGAYAQNNFTLLEDRMMLFPEDAPLHAFLPGWSEDVSLRASDPVAFDFEFVAGYGADCFTAPDFRPERHKNLCGAAVPLLPDGNVEAGCGLGTWPLSKEVRDVCDAQYARDFLPDAEKNILRQVAPPSSGGPLAGCAPDPARKNRTPDGVPDVLWVPSRDEVGTLWGTPDAEAAGRQTRPDWVALEQAVQGWSEQGCPDNLNPFEQTLVPFNRSLPICGGEKAVVCPDGEPASLYRLLPGDVARPGWEVAGHPDLEYVCPVAKEGPPYQVPPGKSVTLTPPFDDLGDDDWLVNVWVSGASNGGTPPSLNFEYPDRCDATGVSCKGKPGYCVAPQQTLPFEPFFQVRRRTPTDPLPTITVTAHHEGQYEVTMLLRNSARARRVARFKVDVGRWRGIWVYTTDEDRYTAGAGSAFCCEWNEGAVGEGCYNRTIGRKSYTYLDLGTDFEPRKVKEGVQRYSERDGCPHEWSTVPNNAEVHTVRTTNFASINGGMNGERTVGKMLCTGWDNTRPDSTWASCKQSAVPDPGQTTCANDMQCF